MKIQGEIVTDINTAAMTAAAWIHKAVKTAAHLVSLLKLENCENEQYQFV